MERLRIGVIGVGSMGYNHARVCAELPEIELVGVVDSCAERSREVGEKFSTQSFTNPHDLVGKVDAVLIVAPTAYHYQLTKMFLDYGIHVLVEKPITVEAEEARELVNLARAKGLVLQVGHLERFNPAVVKLREVINKPILLEAHRLSARTTRNLDVGISWDLMIHDYDLMLSLLQDDVISIGAFGTSVYSDFEDIALVQLRFRGGAMANLIASRNSAERNRGLKVTEADGRVLWLDYINQTLQVAHIGEDGRPSAVEDIPVEKAEPLKKEIADFARCVREHGAPVVSGDDGLRALELAIRVRAAMQVASRA